MAPIFENKGDKKPGESLGKPAPQGDDPKVSHTAEGVIPPGLESKEGDPIGPPPGDDHDSVLRAAKHAGAAGHALLGVDDVEEIGNKVAKARRLVAKRNLSNDAGEVKKIDAEIEALGFTSPYATTEAQRSTDAAPAGRRAPGNTTA